MADCGDVMDAPNLKRMLAAYVAMSRVRKADALLIVRAFAQDLFSQGPPPGPHCLMKLLRARCTVAPGSLQYTLDEANEEYERLQQARGEEQKMAKQTNTTWQCYDCLQQYPPEAFGADSAKITTIFEKCMAPGQWLSCSGCSAAHSLVRDHPKLWGETTKCTSCEIVKSVAYFTSDASELNQWCRSCELRRAFQPQTCSKCMKKKFGKDFPASNQECVERSGQAAEEPICFACRLAGGTHFCTICESSKSWTAFPKRSLCNRTKTYLLRCNDCFTCEGCKAPKTDARSFALGSRYCWSCYSENQDMKCEVCQVTKKRMEFTDSQISNWNKDQNKVLRCTACFTCTQCQLPKSQINSLEIQVLVVHVVTLRNATYVK